MDSAIKANVIRAGDPKRIGQSPQCIACGSEMSRRFGHRAPSHWQCRECGLECISPQPSDASLASMYNESYYSHYALKGGSKQVRMMKRATYARHLRWLGRLSASNETK